VWLLLFRQFRLETRLTPEEVADRLAAAVGPPRIVWWGRPDRPFQGEATTGRFRLMRVAVYDGYPWRDWLRPRVRGRVSPAADGAVVEGVITAHWAGHLWWTGLLVITVLSLRAGLLALYAGPPWHLDRFLLALLAFAFFWALSVGRFHLETRWSLATLKQLITADAEITESAAP
jgi:hypothetical protein